MTILFAPLEGITGWVYRRAHAASFPGADAYYTPFLSPTADSPLAGRGLTDVLPAHNQGVPVPVIPQLLTNKAEDFLAAAQGLADLGYREVNLNLGCPSGTVVAKGKGSGFLPRLEDLARFFDQVCALSPLPISVKTRVGLEQEEEWPALLALYDRYPLKALIVHPRIRRDFYRGPVRLEAFRYAEAHTRLPLCYNGDLFTPQQCRDFALAYPNTAALMVGRGMVADPSLARQLKGGPALTKAELQAFHDQLVEDYRQVLSGDRPVLGKMKELWTYWACLFPAPEKHLKAMRKARSLAAYRDAAAALFRDQDLVPGGHFIPPHHR
jgi:tRNA-dihydrouridine synthase